jgi:ComEC/Rec2-related protein
MLRRYPAIYLLTFVLAGIVTADLSDIASWWFLCFGLIVGVAGISACLRQQTVPTAIFLGLTLSSFSGFLYSHRYVHVGPRHVSRVMDQHQRYYIYGRVSDWPELKVDRTEVTVDVDSLVADRLYQTEGAILLKISDTTTQLQRGDRIAFRGRIYPLPPSSPVGGFDYRRYLQLRSIAGIVYLPTLLDVRVERRSHYTFLSIVDNMRQSIVDAFRSDLSPAAAALATGFLIGETRNIPVDVYTKFRDSGTLHLLAVSGSNVALVLLFFVLVLRPLRISPGKRAIALMAIILVFAGLSYGEPSVIRASIMAGLVLLSRLIQRRHNLNNIIALTAVLILLFEPAQFFDVGFQLSFVTAWGLIFIVPLISRRLSDYHQRRWYRWLLFPLVISIVAQVCSTPLIICYFGRLPVVSVPANLVVVPLVSVAVVGSLVLLMAHAIWPLLGLFVGSLVNRLLLAVIWVLDRFGGDHMPVIETQAVLPDSALTPLAILAYVLIVVAALAVVSPRVRRLAAILIVILINAVLLLLVIGTSRSGHRITVHSVPGGAVAVVETLANSHADLIVLGTRGRPYPIDERIIKPMLAGVYRLDRIFLLSAEYDALEDYFQLACDLKVDTLFAAEWLRPTLAEISNRLDSRSYRPTLVFSVFSGEPIGRQGLSLSRLGLTLSLDHSRVIFSDELMADHGLPASQSSATYLVTGDYWRPTPAELADLAACGYRLIVCSKIDQYLPDDGDPQNRFADLVLPEFIHDLSRRGSLRLSFP